MVPAHHWYKKHLHAGLSPRQHSITPEQLLNHFPVTVSNLPAGPRKDDVQHCSVPSLTEVSATVKRLRNGKAPGLCGISAEMLKASGHAGMQWLTDVIVQAWNTGEIPLD